MFRSAFSRYRVLSRMTLAAVLTLNVLSIVLAETPIIEFPVGQMAQIARCSGREQ